MGYIVVMENHVFKPTLAALEQRIQAIRVDAYAQTRNDLNGAVTRLSPYLTHGFTDVPTLVRRLMNVQDAGKTLSFDDKIIFEFAWREFFQHVWAHRGDAILDSLGEPVFDGEYAAAMPDDVLTATTGVPAIDCAVRELYATGYLHNHARMWLASYVIHIRKISWRAGADWLYAHLLDGDLPSNHLSWQWVAGTFSSKPYVFNAENVARFAPLATHAAWRSEGSVIDQSYEALDVWARSARRAKPPPGQRIGIAAPRMGGVPDSLGSTPDLAMAVTGKNVYVLHPWSLREPPAGATVVAWLSPDFHAAHPWSARRWDWVTARMGDLTSLRFVGGAQALRAALAGASGVTLSATPHHAYAAAGFVSLPVPRLLPTLDTYCASFSKFYHSARKQVKGLESSL